MSKRPGFVLVIALGAGLAAADEPHDPPDSGQPGDAMIQAYLAREASRLHAQPLDLPKAGDERARLQEEYLYMLGLSPTPPRSPLHATVTGTVEADGFTVENLHYQSLPGLYVTANLYRPAKVMEGTRLPAVLYVCGHAGMGRDGGKAAFQSHGIWFARHGYVCLIVDTLQLGEIPGIHHGTYRERRWWWHSRGYTPAGVECWNGVRGIDYLVGRPEVDPDRIGVTGISGGGAATFWIAAADDRVKVAVPISGMADLPAYVTDRVVNGHCDCMFLHNTFAWPWARIAGLIAPRPLLFINSDADTLFPMGANERVIALLERLYGQHGAGGLVDAVVSVGGHDYRQDIRSSTYRFLNAHLKGDPRPVEDGEADLIADEGGQKRYPIEPGRLRVFRTDADLPADRRNAEIDRHFVPIARVEPPAAGQFEAWKARLLGELRRVTFRPFPERIPPARRVESDEAGVFQLLTEMGIVVPMSRIEGSVRKADARRILLAVGGGEAGTGWLKGVRREGDLIFLLYPRGVGPTGWTTRNPPNTVERSHALLGRTADGGRVQDVIAAARYLHALAGGKAPLVVAGEGPAGVLGAYAALLEPEIAEVVAIDPPVSHMDAAAPQLLNALRVLDIPEAFGMLAPRRLVLRGGPDLQKKVRSIYTAAGAGDHFEGH